MEAAAALPEFGRSSPANSLKEALKKPFRKPPFSPTVIWLGSETPNVNRAWPELVFCFLFLPATPSISVTSVHVFRSFEMSPARFLITNGYISHH